MYDIQALELKAVQIRRDILELVTRGQGPAHPAPSLSCADILTALYFGVLRVDPANPQWADRDRFILSKGHAAPALYAALAEKGYFDRSWFPTLRRCGSRLQGHHDMTKTPGVDMTTGSLGHGLSAGVGMAVGLKLRRQKANVYVLLGDGEIQEGIVWEAAMTAGRFKLDNLIAMVDYNHIQSSGFMEDIMPMEPLRTKWESFGFHVLEMNGHNMREILDTLERAKVIKGAPVMIIAHTTKGQGVSYMENDPSWHTGIPTPEQYRQAMAELDAVQERILTLGGSAR